MRPADGVELAERISVTRMIGHSLAYCQALEASLEKSRRAPSISVSSSWKWNDCTTTWPTSA